MQMQDQDGVPPGLDRTLTGQSGIITFTGKFYADNYAERTIKRMVVIAWASVEIFIAKDTTSGGIYVVDRARKLSLGCRMNATFEPFAPEPPAVPVAA